MVAEGGLEVEGEECWVCLGLILRGFMEGVRDLRV